FVLLLMRGRSEQALLDALHGRGDGSAGRAGAPGGPGGPGARSPGGPPPPPPPPVWRWPREW
ncbi:hypothetical protein ACFSJI_32795, partial [Streptomyces calvus]